MMQTISNPSRECGSLVEGSCYAMASFSKDGNLLPITWTLGHHVYGGYNLSVEVPARENLFIDPEMTIDMRELITYRMGQANRALGSYDRSELPQLQRLGDNALIDHVGMNNYTAWSFAQEVMKYGPSRKIAPKLAKQIANMLPLRIFFTADLPIFESNAQRDDFIRACEIALPEDVGYEHTWKYTNWGARLTEYDDYQSIMTKSGSWHYLLPVLKYLDKERDWLDVRRFESIYAFSWITDVYYIVPKGQDEEDVPSDIIEAGIVPVRAAEKGQVVS
jgi:hypothetical protein